MHIVFLRGVTNHMQHNLSASSGWKKEEVVNGVEWTHSGGFNIKC